MLARNRHTIRTRQAKDSLFPLGDPGFENGVTTTDFRINTYWDTIVPRVVNSGSFQVGELVDQTPSGWSDLEVIEVNYIYPEGGSSNHIVINDPNQEIQNGHTFQGQTSQATGTVNGAPLRSISQGVGNPVRAGNYAAQCTVFYDYRNELILNIGEEFQDHKQYWFGQSVYLKDWAADYLAWSTLQQMHTVPGDNPGTGQPDWSCNTPPNTWSMAHGHPEGNPDPNAMTIGFQYWDFVARSLDPYILEPSEDEQGYPLNDGTYNKHIWSGAAIGPDEGWSDFVYLWANQWIDVIVNWIPSSDDDGFIRTWINGKLVLDYRGPNLFYYDRCGRPRQSYTYYQTGIYKERSQTAVTRTMFLDNSKFAFSPSMFNIVDPKPTQVAGEPPGEYSNEYQTVYDYWTTKPSSDLANAQNIMVSSIIAGSAWSGLDLFIVLAGHTNDNNESLVNWISPGTYNGVLVGTPTFTALEGFLATATGQYINTNWNLSTAGGNYTQDSGCLGGYSRTANRGTQHMLGAHVGPGTSARAGIIPYYLSGDGKFYTWSNTSVGDSTGSNQYPGAGMSIISRVSSTEYKTYRNLVNVDTFTRTSEDLPNVNLYALTANVDGSPSASYYQNQLSLILGGAGVTQAHVTTIVNAFETYMTYNGKGL